MTSIFNSARRPVVAVYRDVLWNPFEPFILNQSGKLRRYEPRYFGIRPVNGLVSPPEKTFVLNSGGLADRLAELTL